MAEGLLSALATQGVLGIMLALALLVIAILFRMLLMEKDKRIDDASNFKDDLVGPLKLLQESMDIISAKIRISKEIDK